MSQWDADRGMWMSTSQRTDTPEDAQRTEVRSGHQGFKIRECEHQEWTEEKWENRREKSHERTQRRNLLCR